MPQDQKPTATIIIRTYNESRHLGELLAAIRNQSRHAVDIETVVIDSGSTDATLDIAARFGCRVKHIAKEDFTFGRSLNIGCHAANGDYLIFVSGHCIPVSERWVEKLITPFTSPGIAYIYGRQLGNETSRFSEIQHFAKYFPSVSQNPQDGFFCNNANAALRASLWREEHFNEELTGLEDLELAKRLVNKGHQIAYQAEAEVLHLHDENWRTIRRRYEREAIALQKIMPEIQVSLLDFVRYFVRAVTLDGYIASQQGRLLVLLPEIASYRLAQFWGTYRGNHEHRKLSKAMKERLFYPK